MKDRQKPPAFFAALLLALGLTVAACGEDAATDDGASMGDTEETLNDGIDPETGNPPEL